MKDGRTSVLFLCVANSCRSQMAEAIARSLVDPSKFHIQSAGAMPSSRIDPGAVDILRKHSIPVAAEQHPKSIQDIFPIEQYDHVVALCAEACVDLPELDPNTQFHQWIIKDPTSGQTSYQQVFETLERNIRALFD